VSHAIVYIIDNFDLLTNISALRLHVNRDKIIFFTSAMWHTFKIDDLF